MDKLELTGQNQGRVFNSRKWLAYGMPLYAVPTNTTYLIVENSLPV